MASCSSGETQAIKDLLDHLLSLFVLLVELRWSVNRAFQALWLNKFHWLHYDATSACAFYCICCKAPF